MKIAEFGLGYVGLSNAVLLAQHNEVVAVDISADRVEMLNSRHSPIVDAELQESLSNRALNITAMPEAEFYGSRVSRDLASLREECEVIIANRLTDAIGDVQEKVFTRDLFGSH